MTTNTAIVSIPTNDADLIWWINTTYGVNLVVTADDGNLRTWSAVVPVAVLPAIRKAAM